MQRSSQRDSDELILQPAAIPLGAVGLDLRAPTNPGALTKLINARYRDEKTLDRRSGYRGVRLQDGSEFNSTSNAPTGWVYGIGQVAGGVHHPKPLQTRGGFTLGNTDVAWTGDRLLIVREGETCIGQHEFWSRGDGEVLDHGIPAYLPVQTDSTPPDVISGDYVETALTNDLRGIIASTAAEEVVAWIVHRETGAVLDRTVLDYGTAIRDARIINSDGQLVAMWRDTTTLRTSWWSGSMWAAPSVVSNGCDSHEVFQSSDGMYLMWREAGTLKIGKYLQHAVSNSPLPFGTDLGLTTSGAYAFAVSADSGTIAVAYQNTGLYGALFDTDGTVITSAVIDSDAGPYDGGIAVSFRGLSDNWVVHAGNGDVYVRIAELDDAVSIVQQDKRYNSHVASKSFVVGDEVFCWLRSRNSETNYLVAGVTKPLVCGIADREEAILRVVNDGVKSLPLVSVDPLDEYAFTWARPYTTSRTVTIDDEDESFDETYARAGNARLADMQFLPKLSAVQYGESVYLAGSLVRNWDGIELGDAGFSDYAKLEVPAQQPDGTGSLYITGTYRHRVYAVRYNKQGERFQSVGVQGDAITLTGTNDGIELTIHTIPCTNHEDVRFEVYRTGNGGTTYYLEGTVENDLTARFVTFTSTMADATLITQQGDPHAPGIGLAAEIEELAPIGCEILCVAGDRLWGAGGQVPSGTVQFSKLKEPGEGAGFDALAGTQQVDTQGGRITSIAAFGDVTLFFQDNGFQAMTASGPNNYGGGGFGVPQLVLSDGATTHAGTVVTPIGVAYWGADGPRLVPPNMQSVDQICAPVRELSKAMTPSGVQIDLARQEVIWYTEEGDALLWSYRAVEQRFNQLTSLGRWAQWTGLEIAGAAPGVLFATDGRVLYEDEDAYGDAGVPFCFSGATGAITPSEVLGARAELNLVGVVGEYLGPHDLRLKVYYNGSPMWTEGWTWDPTNGTGLQSGTELGELTAAQIDALQIGDKSGQYATHKKVKRHDCRTFRLEWSDISSFRPTCRLHELSLELAARGGLGRVQVNTFTRS